MPEGVVDKYSEHKGLGYIIRDDGKEIFVERSSIEMDGYKTLVPGERVRFEVEKTVRGLKAKKVKTI